ncbi:hypothetical protein SDC9_57327 [bioreactor metagenome]|uniref:Uncharacterized protein n=1 Tax=bioreactor metagenome TaxID=1076179 RepID=A0A644X4M1_9ZZZZ
MAGAEAAFKELLDIDLGTGCSEGKEIQVMDMDIALPVRSGVVGVQNIEVIELLCPL